MKPTGVIIVDGCEDLEITQEGLDRANKKIQATIKKRTEPKPEFVPPPPCIPCTTDWGVIAAKQAKFEVVPPYYARATLWFVVGILVGVLGCLYATSHIS